MSWLNKTSRLLFIFSTLCLWPISLFLTLQTNTLSNPETIFSYDYQKRQAVLRKTYLYPNLILARLFQNKVQIPLYRFEENITALLDPNNYFFGFHPRELGNNLNLVKFPFVSLPIFAYGFFCLKRFKKRRLVAITLILSLVLLSFLKSFDRFDFLLYPSLIAVFLLGERLLRQKRARLINLYFLISLPFAFIEVLRQIIIYAPQ